MSKRAILVGDAPQEYRQKKMEETYDFLRTKEGGALSSGDFIGFPNGVSEFTLETVLNAAFDEQPEQILLYFCTKEPVGDDEDSVWLGGEEIRKDVIAYYQKLAKDLEIDFQTVFDVCREFISEEKLGYEKI